LTSGWLEVGSDAVVVELIDGGGRPLALAVHHFLAGARFASRWQGAERDAS
jgi:hypothetical protein